MKTEDKTTQLIDALVQDCKPCKGIWCPFRQALKMILIAGVIMAGLSWLYGWPEDVTRADRYIFVLGILTALLAGMGTFVSSIPGFSRWWVAPGMVMAVMWFGLQLMACRAEEFSQNGMDYFCPIMALVSSVAAMMLAGAMLARSLPLDRVMTGLSLGLAAFALSSTFWQFVSPGTHTDNLIWEVILLPFSLGVGVYLVKAGVKVEN